MNETTHVYGTRPARWNRWWLVAIAAPVALLVLLAGYALSGGGGTQTDPTAGGGVPATSGSPAADDVDAAGDGVGDAAGGSGAPGGDDAGASGGSGTSGGGDTGASGGSSDGTGSGPEDSGEPPYIRDLYHDAFMEATGDGDTVAPTVIMQGHAFDPDGPDSQERVARVDIDWGDGSVTAASLGGHGAFDAQHVYASTFAGQTVTVRIVAHGHDGRTAARSVDLALPIM